MFNSCYFSGAVQANRFNNRFYTLLADPKVRYKNVDKSDITNFPRERFQWDGFKRKTQVL